MKHILLLAIFSFSTFYSLSQLTSKTTQVGSLSRSYLQYLPSGFNPQTEQVSLVVILHGLGGNSSQMVGAGFNNIADTARAIALYPQARNNNQGQAAWNNGTFASSTADDISFMNQLVDSMILNYRVDPSKVYFTGFSMGSIMSYHVACLMNNRVAAVGCMAGTMSTSDINTCNPAYATPVIHLHGTADGTVPYNSGALPSLSLVPETMAFWQGVHGCSTTADSLRISNTASDNITVDRFRYDNCAPASSLELWRLNGADHIYLYKPVNDITEMIEVWLFMRRWTHPSPLATGLDENKSIEFTIHPNPIENETSISVSEQSTYSLFSANGKVVQSGKLMKGTSTISLANHPAGTYLIQIGNQSKKVVKL